MAIVSNIGEMQIGDKIYCSYKAGAGTVGVFHGLGVEQGTAIPVAGTNVPDGYFFFIHSGFDSQGHMKLIADRNVQHSISWDTLKKAGVTSTDGVPIKFNTIDTIPAMTSNTTPSGVVSASNNSTDAYTAFDGIIPGIDSSIGRWYAGTYVDADGANWIKYDYGVGNEKKINAFRIHPFKHSTSNYNAKAFKIQASQDGSNWIDLLSVTESGLLNDGGPMVFYFENDIAYRFYRFYCTICYRNGTNALYLAIAELQFLEVSKTSSHEFSIRILSGGTSNTDIDNEWNQIIVSSDLNGTINPGDSSVWNWGLASWTSTPLPVTIANRVYRGGAIVTTFAHQDSTASNATTGFRPVMLVKLKEGNPPIISNVNLSNTTIWYQDTDDVLVKFQVTSGSNLKIKYKVEVNGQGSDYSDFIDTPTGEITIQLSKSLFNASLNNLTISVLDEDDGVASWEYQIKREDVDTLVFERLFDFSLEWSPNENLEITQDVGLTMPGIGSQIITTYYNPIHTIEKATISSIAVSGSNLDDSTSIVRFLVSKDGKNTWYSYNEGFVQVSLSDIYTQGMSKSGLEGITQSQWRDWFSRGTLDFAIGIYTSEGMQSTSIIRSITVTFPADEAPLIQNPALNPDTIHNEFVFLTATLNDMEGSQVKYKIEINGTQVYPSEGWSVLYNSPYNISHGYNYPYFNIGDNTVTLRVADEDGRERAWSGTVVLTETAPIITVTHTDFTLNGSIGDAESDQVAYRILINGVQKFPMVGEWSDFADSPRAISFEWDNADVMFGETNTVRVESKDQMGLISYIEFSFIGTYKGIMFTDDNGEYYSDYAGVLLKYLDMGTLVAGRMTDPVKVYVLNKNGFPVENIRLSRDNTQLPVGVEMQLSKQEIPFVSEDSLIYTQVLADSEDLVFYTRVVADENAHGSGEFDILVNADPID